jgi:uncharacterized protein YegL
MRFAGVAGLLLLPLMVAPGVTAVTTGTRDLDLVFVIDTTGSMAGELREAKERVQQLATALREARPGATVRLGVVAYRDRGDAYVTRVSPLSAEVAQSFDFLATLRAEAGGDSPEDVLSGLAAALHEIEWSASPTVDRQVFLIGDAPPHLDYADGARPEDLFREAAERSIVLNMIGCRSLSGDGVAFFRKAAYATEGTYQHIGRVEVAGQPEAGVAAAVLSALDVEGAPEPPGTPLDLVETEVAGTEQGGTESRELQVDQVRDKGSGESCGLTVGVPRGLRLEAEPRVTRVAGGLRVELRLTAGQGERRAYRFSSCVPLATTIHVLLEEGR